MLIPLDSLMVYFTKIGRPDKILIKIVALCVVPVLLGSCSTIQETAIPNLHDGRYTLNALGNRQTVIVDVAYDTVRIHCKAHGGLIAELAPTMGRHLLPDVGSQFYMNDLTLLRRKFDLDFLTIPVKLRMPQSGVPAQLNTNFTGAIFLGYRTDRHLLNYELNYLGNFERTVVHKAYSVGILSGFGNSMISPTSTGNILQMEYDGLVWSKGVAGILVLNNFKLGLAVGFDNLLDHNRHHWIYENQAWYGIAVGINLN